MVNKKLPWSKALEDLLKRNPDLKYLDQPDRLDYYRHDLNVDLPPLLRDLLLNSLPDLVLQPRTENQVVAILTFAREHRAPLTLRGAGTWGYGGAVPTQGGLLIDLGLMDTIEVDPGALRLTVGPGTRFLDIHRVLKQHGLALLTMTSGKGGTLIGWMATGGLGFGTFHHGPIRNQLVTMRVATPDGAVKDLKAEDPEIEQFLSTEGQMGVILSVTIKVGKEPPEALPVVIPFDQIGGAYTFVRKASSNPSFKPEDLVVYHSELIRALKDQSEGGLKAGTEHLVLAVFSDREEAGRFRTFLDGQKVRAGEDSLAKQLWEDRFLPMSVKSQGASLLASEVLLPIDEVASYTDKINEWGKKLGLTLYPTSHVVDPDHVLFLALMTTDHRKALFYIDLMLVPMMVRLAVQVHRGKPYGLGIWNTPFLKDLYPKDKLKALIQYKKKVDPQGILNPGKFFEVSGKLGSLQKTLFRSGVFNFEMAAVQWLLFKFFSVLPKEAWRRSVPVIPEGLREIEKDVMACAQCGSCVSRCPLFRAFGDETYTARGKLLTIKRALETKKLELSKVLPLYFCIHCGRCDEECQVHLKHKSLFEHLEQYLSKHIDFPIKEITRFIQEIEASPEFSRFLEVVRTGFDQKIKEQRQTFPKYRVTLDEEYCIHCGTCVDACMYSVRKRDEADPRRVVIADESLCRGCGACIERCPQLAQGLAATTVELHPMYLNLTDPYWNSEVVTRIDLEATTGKIPVSGTGQGDPHRGFGNDGIRFGHFHIVGPAQNLLYESSADAIHIQLGRRPKYLTLKGDALQTPRPRLIALNTPILIDTMPMEAKEDLLESMYKAAAELGTRLTLRPDQIERLKKRVADPLGNLILRLTPGDLSRASAVFKDPSLDLVEIELTDGVPSAERLRDLFRESTVLSAVIRVRSRDVDAELKPVPALRKKLESLFDSPFDILVLTSDDDPEKGYYATTDAVPAVHRFLVEQKIRHRFSILASGGLRSAADTQKTIQRGANGVKIDWPVLLTVDPMARQKFLAKQELEGALDVPSALKRIANLIRVWNIQIIEVLGASGFKDIKKTVGEENRLLIFDDLEERIYDIFKSPERIELNRRCNQKRIEREGNGSGWRYTELKGLTRPVSSPHQFHTCNLKPSCYKIFDRDHVWPGALLTSAGRMASGDPEAFLLRHVKERGNLGDGFDDIQLRFKEDPDSLPDRRMDEVLTGLQIAPQLKLKSPFIGAGMSVGSIGPGTWRARVLATKRLDTQLDTGEGGYPTSYILDAKWNPIGLTDQQVLLVGRLMEERRLTPIEKVLEKVRQELDESPEYPGILEVLNRYPASLPIQYVPIVTPEDEAYISTQLKTGLFGVTKETIRKARRVVIAYSQGAKQGVGGHLLGRKVFGLVSLLRGVGEGISLISPFPFHNCYSIEDVKAFIDAVRMINRKTTICIKVSPSPDIEFIVSGLARIAKDDQMVIEVWLDGPRGGTGAAPDIIKGQMGMHMEYAIPLCHEKLMGDGLRDHVVFMGSGGFRTWGDIVKGIAMGLDGVILGTADLVAIGCVRDRNCESGCRSGISTIEPRMQLLRDVDLNSQQVLNFRAILQAQVARAIAGLGIKDIRELRGRYEMIHWPLMEARVEDHRRRRSEALRAVPPEKPDPGPAHPDPSAQSGGTKSPSDCGVAAIVSNHLIPSYIMDLMLDQMANRGMDGVGIWKGGCFSHHMDHYALQVLVKGTLQSQVEDEIRSRHSGMSEEQLRQEARSSILTARKQFMREMIDRDFRDLDIDAFDGDLEKCRFLYKRDEKGRERDFRHYGEKDPGDVFLFFVRVKPEGLRRFIEKELWEDPVWPCRSMRYASLTRQNYDANRGFLQEAEDEYIYRLSQRITLEHYTEAQPKRAAVLSCGKNSGCWKTDGQQIPWELPDAPVNIIHRRLATGSVVDQMNAHPFAELHTALTHNGETTNYRTMVNRCSQFNLRPLAQTDTAIASLKLHLVSQYLHYPFDVLVESFSPTTGFALTQLPPEVRERFERVQEVELESAPDGPYQYLCGRIDPYKRMIERLDIIDPSLLRPNVAMLYDDGTHFINIICSEKQGSDAGISELYRLGMMKSIFPPLTFTVTNGMISRVYYDERGKITRHEVLDKFGKPISIPCGAFPEKGCEGLIPGDLPMGFQEDPAAFFRERLPEWTFGEFKKASEKLSEEAPDIEAVEKLTKIYDTLPGWDTGGKDRGALLHLLRNLIDSRLDKMEASGPNGKEALHVTLTQAGKLEPPKHPGQTLVVDARGFRPEGIDPQKVLSCFLDHAHRMNWRKFIVYRASGQRGIGMGMGSGNTTGTVLDVYGSPGEYCGAFNMGTLVRVHNHAQNFTGMVMHSGALEIHGDAGKVTGYSSKGGTFHILGNVVDRGWVCAVSDPRGPGLQVNVVGTAYEHLGQALMGGSMMMLGLYRDHEGLLHRRPTPYSGGKILAGASAGEVLFYDPERKLDEAQYRGCRVKPVDEAKWDDIAKRLLYLEAIFGIGIGKGNGHLTIRIDGKVKPLTPEHFLWVVPTGGLEGYH